MRDLRPTDDATLGAAERKYAPLAAAIRNATGLHSKVQPGSGDGALLVTYIDGLEAGDQGRVYHSWADAHPDRSLEGTIDFFASPDEPGSEYVFVAVPEEPATVKEWVAAIIGHLEGLGDR